MKKILVFDIESEKARFRTQHYENITHIIPPRATIAGTIAGMMGFPSYLYPQDGKVPYEKRFHSDKCNIAVEILSDVEKFIEAGNECLRAKKGNLVSYRIYFHHIEMEVMDELKECLETKNFVYQPSMGLQIFKAFVRYVGEFDIEKVLTDDFVHISTAVGQSNIKDIHLVTGNVALTGNMVRDYDENHDPLSVEDYRLFDGVEVDLKDRTYYKTMGKNIVFM